MPCGTRPLNASDYTGPTASRPTGGRPERRRSTSRAPPQLAAITRCRDRLQRPRCWRVCRLATDVQRRHRVLSNADADVLRFGQTAQGGESDWRPRRQIDGGRSHCSRVASAFVPADHRTPRRSNTSRARRRSGRERPEAFDDRAESAAVDVGELGGDLDIEAAVRADREGPLGARAVLEQQRHADARRRVADVFAISMYVCVPSTPPTSPSASAQRVPVAVVPGELCASYQPAAATTSIARRGSARRWST